MTARLEETGDAPSAFPSFLRDEYAGQKAVRFHPQRYRLQSRRCYCAREGFFSAASEVIRAPPFEVAVADVRRGGRPTNDRLLQSVSMMRRDIS